MSTEIAPSGQPAQTTWGNYLDMLALEKVEIDRIKWLESERLGFDCGIDRAVWVWETRERAIWLKRLRETGR